MVRANVTNSWLLVVDPQNIFADQSSPWGSLYFESAWQNIAALQEQFAARTVITRWIPTPANKRNNSWREYFEHWQFADIPASDPQYELTGAAQKMAATLAANRVLTTTTMSKWGQPLRRLVGEGAHLFITGVTTDCCVISTVLAAIDDGVYVTVVSDAVAHSTTENGAAAMQVMALFKPHVEIKTTRQVLHDFQAAANGGSSL
ncbi:cysteine hydrolase [Canibacter sp. lx-45]|nr:cysteine hydrolase [Canibacter zhuwentaonis]